MGLVLLPTPVVKLYCNPQLNRTEFKWWMVFGGVMGVTKTVIQAISGFKLIDNIVLQSLGFNLGQLASGSVVDHFGVLGAPKKSITWMKLAALLLFSAGLTLFSVQNGTLDFNEFIFVAFSAGLFQPLQSSLNRRASESMPYMIQVNGLNYASGFIAISMVFFVKFMWTNGEVPPMEALPWYVYILPPAIGSFLLFAGYFFAPKIGMAMFVIITILAEVVTSTVLTSIGFASSNHSRFTWWTAGGLVTAFFAALLMVVSQYKTGKELDKNETEPDPELVPKQPDSELVSKQPESEFACPG